MYQLHYSYAAAQDLGEKYQEPLWQLYEIGTLIPGVFIGACMVLKQQFGWKDDCISRISKWSSIFYMDILGLLTFVWIYMYFPIHFQQNERQHVRSSQKAFHFYIYYFGIMQYAPSWILSLLFLRTEKVKCC